jgi:cytochrome c oxidase cbb3-type subunit 4
MNPVWGLIAGILIVGMMIAFLGTWIWLWNSRHRPKFDALSRLPMADAEENS